MFPLRVLVFHQEFIALDDSRRIVFQLVESNGFQISGIITWIGLIQQGDGRLELTVLQGLLGILLGRGEGSGDKQCPDGEKLHGVFHLGLVFGFCSYYALKSGHSRLLLVRTL